MIKYDESWWIGLLSFVYRSDSELDILQGPTAWIVLPKRYDVIRQFEVRNQNSKQDARTLLYTRSCFMIFIEGQATLVACSALQHRIRNGRNSDEQWRTPLAWHTWITWGVATTCSTAGCPYATGGQQDPVLWISPGGSTLHHIAGWFFLATTGWCKRKSEIPGHRICDSKSSSLRTFYRDKAIRYWNREIERKQKGVWFSLDAFPRRPWKRPTRPTIWASTFLNLPRRPLCCFATVLWVLWCLYRFASLHIPSKCEGSKECKSAVWTFSIIFYHGLLQSRPIQPRNTVLYPAKVCFIWLVFFRRGSEIRYVFFGGWRAAFSLFHCFYAWWLRV